MSRIVLRVVPIATCAVMIVGCAENEAPPPKSTPERPVIVETEVGVSDHPPIRRAPPQFEDSDPEAVKIFYDVLAAYGMWTDDSRLGFVWLPSKDFIGAEFVPYATHGRWTNREVAGVTDWVWLSDLPWGWVTFHYGRWAYTGDRGWAWIAGRRYAGAWVDWRIPPTAGKPANAHESIIGWGPTPPSFIWRLPPGEERAVPTPYSAFATPYVYTRTKDLFAPNVGRKLFPAGAALSVAYTTEPGTAPRPEALGFERARVPAPPPLDRGLQQAWMLATPATASAVGQGPKLGSPPQLSTFVAGGPQYQ
jgi:hypothetical protein